MKQLIVMVGLTLCGTFGVVFVNPFCGVAVYYLFAVLRPQYLWEWALPVGVSWSYYVAIVTLLAACGVFFSTRRKTAHGEALRGVWTTSQFWLLAYGLWMTCSYLNAQDQVVAFPVLLEHFKILAMFIAAAVLLNNVKEIRALFVSAALALGYIAYEVNFTYLVNGRLGIYHNGYGGLDNNGAGLMLAMGVPLCLFAWEGTQSRWRWGFLALVPVLLHAVLMTYSRGAMVALLACVPLVILRSRRRKQLALMGVCLFCLLPSLAGAEIQARFFSISDHDRDESAQSRFGSWSAAWRMAKDHPILGVGPRNANLFSFQYGADMEGRTIHNQYLQIAADTGFVGVGLYLGAFGAGWVSLVHCRRLVRLQRNAEGDLLRALMSGIECALCVFAVGGMFLSLEVFELPYLLLLLGTQLRPILFTRCNVAVSVVAARSIRPLRQPGLALNGYGYQH